MEIAICIIGLLLVAAIIWAYRQRDPDPATMGDADLAAEVCHWLEFGEYPSIYSIEQDRRAEVMA